jgi:DNA (cytosine-5)-methyltransferase 1
MLSHIDLYSGIGGFTLAAEWAGFRTVALCEINPYCQSILRHHFPGVPIISDVKEVTYERINSDTKCMGRTERTWQGIQSSQQAAIGQDAGNIRTKGVTADTESQRGGQENPLSARGNTVGDSSQSWSIPLTLLTASPPCQPVSVAGKRGGTADDRWLWDETIRVLEELRPTWCVFENPAGIKGMDKSDSVSEVAGDEDEEGGQTQAELFSWLDGITTEMERIGYRVQPIIIPACAVNAIHRRDRVWIIGYTDSGRRQQCDTGERSISITDSFSHDTHSVGKGLQGMRVHQETGEQGLSRESARMDKPVSEKQGDIEPRLCSMDDGISEGLAGYIPTWAGGEWEMPHPLTTDKTERVNRLTALGNAICVPQAYPILKAIADVERQRC